MRRRGGELELADIRKVIRFLWSGSVNGEEPEITFFGVQSIPRPASIPVNVDAPLTCLSMTWRSSTLLTMAQMLDIGSAQSEFGPPSDWLTFAFQQFEKSITSSQFPPTRPSTGKKRRIDLPLRSNGEYFRAVAAVTKDPRWHAISMLRGRKCSIALSRRARSLLRGDALPVLAL